MVSCYVLIKLELLIGCDVSTTNSGFVYAKRRTVRKQVIHFTKIKITSDKLADL